MGDREGEINQRFVELGIDKDYDELVIKMRNLMDKHFDGHMMAIILVTNSKDETQLDLAIAGCGAIQKEETYKAFGACIEPLRKGILEVFLDGEIRRIATQEGRERRRDEEDLASDFGD